MAVANTRGNLSALPGINVIVGANQERLFCRPSTTTSLVVFRMLCALASSGEKPKRTSAIVSICMPFHSEGGIELCSSFDFYWLPFHRGSLPDALLEPAGMLAPIMDFASLDRASRTGQRAGANSKWTHQKSPLQCSCSGVEP